MNRTLLAILPAMLLSVSAAAAVNAPSGDDSADTLRTSVVTGTRVSMLREQVTAPVSVVGRETIASSDENAVMPVLMEQIPSLFVTSRGVTGYGVSNGAAGAVSLRGLGAAAGRVLILIDGHPQFESIYGHPVADEYLAGNAAKVEVTRGAASVLYGTNAMGGAVNILTRKPVRDGNALDAKLMGGSYGTFRAGVTDQYRSGRFSATGSVSFDRTDGHRANSAFRSVGGMAGAAYQISDEWKASARLSYDDADSQNPGTVADPMFEGTAHTMRGMAGVSVENDYGSTSGTVDLYYNWGNHVINDGHVASKPAQEYLFHGTDYTAGLTAYQSATVFEGNRLTAGLDLMFYGGNAYRNPTTEIYADHKKLDEEALYLFDNQSLGDFNLSAGLRVDRHSACGVQWIPHFGVSWAPEGPVWAKASASKGFRVPNMRELYMYMVANEDLLPEEAWSYDLSVGSRLLDGALNLEAGVFHTKGSNIIEVTVVDGKRQNRNAGAFANTGAEFSADWRIARSLRLDANYSFLHMDKVITGAPVHKGWLGLTWTPGRFSVNAGAMGVSELYLVTGDSPKTSSFVDVKLRAAYKVTDMISVFVRGANLLNRPYETMDGFPGPGATFFGGISVSL